VAPGGHFREGDSGGDGNVEGVGVLHHSLSTPLSGQYHFTFGPALVEGGALESPDTAVLHRRQRRGAPSAALGLSVGTADLSNSIFIRLAETNVRVASNDESFLAYARSHFESVLRPPSESSDVDVDFRLGEGVPVGLWPDPQVTRIGRGIHAIAGRVAWTSVPMLPGLRMECVPEDGRLTIEASYSPSRSLRSRVGRLLRRRRSTRNQLFFELLYYLVYYPVFWRARLSGGHVMHAGGMSVDGLGIVVVGAQGVGKSTLAATLLPRDGVRILSDNILLFDGEDVLACHEPLRIAPDLVRESPGLARVLQQCEVDVPLGRQAYVVDRRKCVTSMKPDVILIPRISPAPTGVRELAAGDVVERVRCFNVLAEEVRNFETFDSVLSLAVPAPGGPGWDDTLRDLASRCRCFEFNVKFGEAAGVTVETLLSELGVTPQGTSAGE